MEGGRDIRQDSQSGDQFVCVSISSIPNGPTHITPWAMDMNNGYTFSVSI